MKHKPRLVISTDGYLPRWDGISRFLSEVIPHLKQLFDITVIAPNFEGTAPDIPGVKVVRLPLMPFKFGDIHFSRFKRSLVREALKDADFVFNQSIAPIGWMTINEASKRGIPVISFIHSIDWELASKSIKRGRRISTFIVKRIARGLYNKCALLLVPGQDVATLLQNAGITVKMQRVTVGVDAEHFTPARSKPRAKRLVGLDPDVMVIGFVGRIAREKDLPTLQDAFDEVRKKHPNTLLLVVGDGLRKELRPDTNVKITGMVDDVVPYLQAMDIYVLPSLTETSSLSTMEAMACALPVLVTPVGNIPSYLKHEKNGWFFSRHDVEDLTKKLNYLLEKPELRGKLGFAARQTMTRHFTWGRTAEKIQELLLSTHPTVSTSRKR